MTERRKSTAVAGLVLALLLSLGLYLATHDSLRRLDLLLYDSLLPLQSPNLSEQIVVVGIDDFSVQELGRWPWSRKRHAELLGQLSRLGARAVGLDILFPEPQTDDPEADSALARALEQNGRVVLAIAPAKQQGSELIAELLPIPQLAVSAAALGHVDVELDVDRLCRSTFLYGGVADARWPSFSLALLETGGGEFPGVCDEDIQTAGPGVGWRRREKMLIPFTRPDIKPRHISYSDVVAGRVAASEIKDKYVLVGMTASGLGDAISTPGTFSHERMPGIEVNAQILNGLLLDKVICELPVVQQRGLTIALIIAVSLIIFMVPLRFGLAAMFLGITATVAASLILLVGWRLWYSPVVAILAIALAWTLWSVWQFDLERRLRRQLLKQLEYQAHYHYATGLPNHRMLMEKLRTHAQEHPTPTDLTLLMVLHINWPGSAGIIMGRPISDAILSAIGARLRSISHEREFIAHLSGDDFAIMSPGHHHSEATAQAATELLVKLQEPLEHKGDKLLLVPQIGVSIWPTDTRDTDSLLRNAYTAMFKSRIESTEQICIYSSSIGEELKTRSQLEQALVFALERGEFEVHYQPQVNAQSGHIVGVESLLRWNNPHLGWVSPGTFVPVAEHVGLIKTIGEWVMEMACRQLAAWTRAGLGPIRVAINVSPMQFAVPDLDMGIQRIIDETGVEPGQVELEITESSLMHDVGKAIGLMGRFKEHGMELAIDDFGTGYSSLSNLRHFPLDRLKIDQAFTREIGESKDAMEITLTILAMAKHLELKVIAEGVETEEQAAFLRQHGCDEFQGYLYGRPVPADEITHRLRAQNDTDLVA